MQAAFDINNFLYRLYRWHGPSSSRIRSVIPTVLLASESTNVALRESMKFVWLHQIHGDKYSRTEFNKRENSVNLTLRRVRKTFVALENQ